jgi:excinuclease ABC subunit B
LVDFGFRLPSAKDNRPLNFKEFLKRTNQLICVSATPGTFEKDNAPIAAEQINRPTGILDPEIIIKKKKGQINNILKEIQKRIKKDQRTLITTLTKKMAEELSDYLLNKGVKVTYLHSDINTLERIEIIKNLKAGKIDVLVGVNLLREGLDLPEVSLVIILDADQEGFLRNETSLIQTIGRAARNIDGQVILYADTKSPSMTLAIEETNRRRRIQTEYNQKHNITPKTVTKLTPVKKEKLSAQDSEDYIKQLEIDLQAAVEELRFEEAASIRDEINSLTRANPNI